MKPNFYSIFIIKIQCIFNILVLWVKKHIWEGYKKFPDNSRFSTFSRWVNTLILVYHSTGNDDSPFHWVWTPSSPDHNPFSWRVPDSKLHSLWRFLGYVRGVDSPRYSHNRHVWCRTYTGCSSKWLVWNEMCPLCCVCPSCNTLGYRPS